jgi:hypothetical protein
MNALGVLSARTRRAGEGGAGILHKFSFVYSLGRVFVLSKRFHVSTTARIHPVGVVGQCGERRIVVNSPDLGSIKHAPFPHECHMLSFTREASDEVGTRSFQLDSR